MAYVGQAMFDFWKQHWQRRAEQTPGHYALTLGLEGNVH